jgi:hypothetical protein
MRVYAMAGCRSSAPFWMMLLGIFYFRMGKD